MSPVSTPICDFLFELNRTPEMFNVFNCRPSTDRNQGLMRKDPMSH